MNAATRLHATLAAVCPIDGVSIGTPGEASSVVVHYASSAIADQEAA